MRLVQTGELVLSYANGQLAFVGVATDLAIDAPRPPEFGSSGDAWASEGWMLPIHWSELPKPVRPQDFWDELKPLLPQERYSPLVLSTGYGSQKAYLCEIGERAFEVVLAHAGSTRPLLPRSSNLDDLLDKLERQIERNILDSGETEREQVVLARRGQGRFRANVCALDASCRLTGIADQRLLVASHIKPWRVCISARERLDGANGLMLTPNADRLFDRGLLTFGNGGEPIFSAAIDARHVQQLALDGHQRRAAFPFTTEQLPYLEYHRANVFHQPIEGV